MPPCSEMRSRTIRACGPLTYIAASVLPGPRLTRKPRAAMVAYTHPIAACSLPTAPSAVSCSLRNRASSR
eukprot:7203817-Lingulodinium_polyedra.AAC.1